VAFLSYQIAFALLFLLQVIWFLLASTFWICSRWSSSEIDCIGRWYAQYSIVKGTGTRSDDQVNKHCRLKCI
jgi:hypothetical protein